MSDWPINPLDIVVVVILVLSVLVSVIRGFVREVLAIASWVGAALVTLYGLPEVRPFFADFIENELIASAVAGVALFVVSLMVFSLISHLLAKAVRGAALTGVDRALGLVFGAARGALLVCLGYLILVWLIPEDQRPAWMLEARTGPYLSGGADFLASLVPEDLVLDGVATAGREIGNQLDLTSTPEPDQDAPDDPAGALDRDGVNQIIENTEQPGTN